MLLEMLSFEFCDAFFEGVVADGIAGELCVCAFAPIAQIVQARTTVWMNCRAFAFMTHLFAIKVHSPLQLLRSSSPTCDLESDIPIQAG